MDILKSKNEATKKLNKDIENIREDVNKIIARISGLKNNISSLNLHVNESIDKIDLSAEDNLNIVLDAFSEMYTSHILYNSRYTRIGNDIKRIECYWRPEVFVESIFIPIKMEDDDQKYIIYGLDEGFGSMVVPSTGDDNLSPYEDFMKSLISSDVPEENLLGVLLSAPEDDSLTYDFECEEYGEDAIHFNLEYHGFNISMYTDTHICGNRWIKVEKDGFYEPFIGPLPKGLDYKKVFEDGILDPTLLEKIELSFKKY